MFVLIQYCYTIPDLHAVRHHSSSTAVRTCLLLDGHEGFLLSKRWPQQNWRLDSYMPSSTIFQTLIRNSTLSSTSALEVEVSKFTRYVNWILPWKDGDAADLSAIRRDRTETSALETHSLLHGDIDIHRELSHLSQIWLFISIASPTKDCLTRGFLKKAPNLTYQTHRSNTLDRNIRQRQ